MSIGTENVKQFYDHTMEYYLAVIMNDLQLHPTILMNLTNIMLSESRKALKKTH